jgi:hypothetical protein
MIAIRSLYFFSIVSVFLLSILGTGAYFYVQHRQRQKYPYGKWENLLKRLGSLDHDHIALIARDLVFEPDRQDPDDVALDSDQLWQFLGGMQGLAVLERNCTVLVDLVFYVQQWYPEALLIAEELRLNAREVQWHIDRLRGAAKTGKLKTATPDYLQQAVAIYYRMSCEVLSLYEQTNLPGLADLQKAL